MFDAPVLGVEPGHFYGWQQIVARLGGSEGLTPLALETKRPFGQKALLLLLSVRPCLHASRHIRRDPRQLGQGSRAITPFLISVSVRITGCSTWRSSPRGLGAKPARLV